jgi:hypothetical protein
VFNHPLVIQICLSTRRWPGRREYFILKHIPDVDAVTVKKWAVPDLDGFEFRGSRVLLRLYMYV